MMRMRHEHGDRLVNKPDKRSMRAGGKVSMTQNKFAPWFVAPLLGCFVALTIVMTAPVDAKPRFAAIAVDAKSGKILFSRDADSHRYPASLTKVMTLYIVFQDLKAGRITLNSKFVVSKHAASMQPSKLGLKPGAKIRVEDAIKALVTKSANDIAVTVAEGISKTEYAFAQRMTRTARYIGMTRTKFRNASGLPDRQQVTTARDMATLGLRVQRDFPKYYRYFSIRKFTYKGRNYFTHNRLLGRYKGTDGIKTGYTRASGFNLTSSVRRGNRHIIGVVLGARSGRSRNDYMMSMLTRSFKRLPSNKRKDIASLAGKPPGLSTKPKPQVATKAPLPAPKPAKETVTATVVPKPAPKPTVSPAGVIAPGKPTVLLPTTVANTDTQTPPSSWAIQIGAFSDEMEAKRRLAATLGLGITQLSGKAPFTVAFYKNDKLLYRARIRGFNQKEARNTCRALKRQSISCFPLAPNG